MSFQPEQKPAQIVKILERENVISFKKKPKIIKDNLKSQNNNEDEDNISAQSSHSGVYSEDVNRFKGKINPLPELGKQKKRFISKNLLAQQFRISNYQQKQVRQQENLMLKQKNNFLSSENMKLKTKISTLEKQNAKLQKMFEEQPLKPKTPGLTNLTKERFRPSNQNISTKMIVKSLKKQLQDLKKQNNNIKSSIKFTTISELECQRDAILEQTNRLRALLQEEQSRRISMKINQQGMSNLQQKISSLHDKNSILMRQNNELKNKLKAFEQGSSKAVKATQNQKNLSKTLYTVRRLLKQKQKEVEQLKEQVKSASSMHSLGVSEKSINPLSNNLMPQNNSNIPRKPSMQRPNPMSKNFDKRIVSKSAQKNGPKINGQKPSTAGQCQTCKQLRSQNQNFKKKIAEYESAFQVSNPLVIPTEPIQRPKEQQVKALVRFIEFRFKAHHLGLNESQKYLLNAENITEEELKKQITLEQFLQIVVTEPFVVLNKRYIEVFLLEICYSEQVKKGIPKIKLDKEAKITKKALLQNYKKLMAPFELLPQAKQEQMFLQIAELVTSYYQQILAAMSNRKNGQGTISQKDLTEFFTQIELQKEYIDFIITQIILESIDLDRLNYFAFFEIFYIPQEEGQAAQPGQPVKKGATQMDKKKRFEVDQVQVVKQQDEEYEQSRSHVDQSRQRTLSKQAQQSGDSYHQLNSDDSPIKKQENEENYEDEYGEQYGEEYQNEQKPQKGQKEQKGLKEQVNELKKPVSSKLIAQKPKNKQKKKKSQKDDSYAEQFQQEKMNSQVQEENKAKPAADKKTKPVDSKNKPDDSKNKPVNKETKPADKKKANNKQPPQKLVEKPYEIQDIEDQYKDEFDN